MKSNKTYIALTIMGSLLGSGVFSLRAFDLKINISDAALESECKKEGKTSLEDLKTCVGQKRTELDAAQREVDAAMEKATKELEAAGLV